MNIVQGCAQEGKTEGHACFACVCVCVFVVLNLGLVEFLMVPLFHY